uniref:Transcription factor CBF/NF-Y/archaeal histone domain-containing protein n=1 Tax=Spongospora subterranea TaxID=70186 RepID=A0A0H5QY41_9EUKA|eukprot:CRZ06840.1 hypothetical protein [Spongospora subterranea]
MAEADDEAHLPKATVAKFCKSVLPAGIRCSVETRDLLCKAASEFIQMLATESLEKATAANKSKITREHLEQACSAMGFEHYIDEMRIVGDHADEVKIERGKKWKSTKTPEELLASQQALFAKAAASSSSYDAPVDPSS